MTEDGRSPVWVLMRVASLLTRQRLGTAAKSADNMTSPCLGALSSPDSAGRAERGNYFRTSIAAFIFPGGKSFPGGGEREREKLRLMALCHCPPALAIERYRRAPARSQGRQVSPARPSLRPALPSSIRGGFPSQQQVRVIPAGLAASRVPKPPATRRFETKEPRSPDVRRRHPLCGQLLAFLGLAQREGARS